MSVIRYKAIRSGPVFQNTKDVVFVDLDEFLKEDKRIPLLVCNYCIYPDSFRDLHLLRNRKIALIGKSYLSGIETEFKEYFLDDNTIAKLTSVRSLVTCSKDIKTGKYVFKLIDIPP